MVPHLACKSGPPAPLHSDALQQNFGNSRGNPGLLSEVGLGVEPGAHTSKKNLLFTSQ